MSPTVQQRLVDPASQGSNEPYILRDFKPQSHFHGTGLQHSGSGDLHVGRDLNIIARDSPPLPQVCRAIHFPRNDDFVQRSALSEQLAKLLPSRLDYQSAALCGLGGSGKTQLALEYAYVRCDDPACSVFWVHADTETSFNQDYKWIATKLGISEDLSGEKLLTAVRAYIETLPQWVLILDNVDDLSLFGVRRGQDSTINNVPNLSIYIPRGTIGTVLWTSRDQRIAGSLVGARRGINVVRMTGAESEALFQAVSILDIATRRERDDLARLLAEVEWLPLAITQIAAYIRRTKTPVAEYLEKIKQRKRRWKVLKRSEHDPHRRPEVSNSILETWNISMEYLQQENKIAYDILTVLAYVDSQNIPFEMITAIVQTKSSEDSDDNTSQESSKDDHLISNVTSSSSDSEVDKDEDDILDAVTRLEEFSFLTLRAAESGRNNRAKWAYDMHKLVQEAVSYNMHLRRGKRSEEAFSAKRAFEVVDKLFPKDWSRETWTECEKYLGHAQRTSEWAQSYDGEESVAWFLSRVSGYLYDRGRWREREVIDMAVLRLHREILGEKHPDTMWSMADLATTYSTQGKYNVAEKIKEEVLELRREILGEKHPDTIRSMAHLATTYHAQGKYNVAEKIYEEVLELRREILGEKHPDTIESMAHLATTYHTQERLRDAEQIYVQVLQLRRDALSNEHPDTIKSVSDLESTRRALEIAIDAENDILSVPGLSLE